jgi:hypothetical protein
MADDGNHQKNKPHEKPSEPPMQRWQEEATANSAALYIQDFFLKGGHDASTRNATATFVHFGGKYYACTCRHALEIAKKRREADATPFSTLMLAHDKTFIPLGFFTAEGFQDSVLIVPPKDETEHYMDLAIADVSVLWPRYSAEARKQAIDMDPDKWREPRRARANMLAAAGYPETGKRNATVHGESRVIGTITLMLAEKSGDLARDQKIVLMRSKLEKPHGWYFSGVSGGPMYVVQDEVLISVGITFEGWPQTKDDRHEELTEYDIMVRGLTLTPDNFKKWLESAGLLRP